MAVRLTGLTSATLATAPTVCHECVFWQSRGSRQLDKDRSAAYSSNSKQVTSSSNVRKERLFANPARAGSAPIAEQTGQLAGGLERSGSSVFRVYFSRVFRLSPDEVQLKPLKKGAKVVAGTILGRIGKLEEGPGSRLAPHLNFSIRPAGRGAPRIDPKPILVFC